ncbi:MAG TPA: hypothetical protein VGD27_10740 [Longimicrobiales bacterium]
MLNELTQPFSSAARVAPLVHQYFSSCPDQQSAVPDMDLIETMIDTAFWASLRREEGRSPIISLTYLPRTTAESALHFARALPFTAGTLARIAPAVERPGIHLAVDTDHGSLRVWGTTRRIPPGSFVLEVIRPGFLVIKRKRASGGKYANVVVLESDELRIIQGSRAIDPAAHATVANLLGLESRYWSEGSNITTQLATSMRAHGRGGLLLVVPTNSDQWQDSFVRPLLYEAVPPYREIAALLEQEEDGSHELLRRERLQRAVDTVAGLTAVDGATVIDQNFQLLAFGAKIRRRGEKTVEQVLYLDLANDGEPVPRSASELGGTRHLSAAQFAFDQRDAVALVASQDDRFTIFAWSSTHEMVSAHRVDALLI